MPFRVFAAGEVLTAANVNDYLAEQAIATFAGTAARASAITAPTEGQFAYLSDSDSLTFYNGSAWVNAGSAIAGTALSSGTATSGQVLTANGSGGVSFSNGGLTLIKTQSFSNVASSSVDDVFSSTYNNYKIIITLDMATSTQLWGLRLRVSGSDVTSNYNSGLLGKRMDGTGTLELNQSTYFVCGYGTVTSTGYNSITSLDITSPFLSQWTFLSGTGAFDRSGVAPYTAQIGGYNYNATSYTGFTIYPTSNNIYGNVSVYGYNK